MAATTVSSGAFYVPPPCGRVRCPGIRGLAIPYKPSGTIQLQVPAPCQDNVRLTT
jgi:hypothetical protein